MTETRTRPGWILLTVTTMIVGFITIAATWPYLSHEGIELLLIAGILLYCTRMREHENVKE